MFQIRHRNQLTAKAWEKDVQELGKFLANSHNKTRQTLQEANLTCTTSSEEANVRQQPGEVNKCPSELLRFLVDFSFVSRCFG